MKPLAYVSAFALAAGLCSTAQAQTARHDADTGPRHAVSSTDYIKESAVSDEFEIEAGKLAVQRAQDPAVKTFAQKMVDEHTKAVEKLNDAAVSAKLSNVPPKALDTKHRALLDDLRGKTGEAFDEAYIRSQLSGHREALNLQKAYNQSGDNPALKENAKAAEPMVQHHLAEAERLAQIRINDTNKQRATPSAGGAVDTQKQTARPGSGSSGSVGGR